MTRIYKSIRNRHTIFESTLLFVLLLAWLSLPAVRAQNTAGPASSARAAAASAPSPADTKPAASVNLAPKEAREAEIAGQAQQLYQIAQELKAEVDKSSKDTLSVGVIKKAAEIEKLARTLKQNMQAN